MQRLGLTGVGLALALAFGCTRSGFLKVPEAGEDTERVGDFAADTHFLLEPIADPTALLGHQVYITDEGTWTIADALAPGCQVRVQRRDARYTKQYRINLGDLTAVAGGYQTLLRLEARHGRSVEAAYEIDNTEIVTADTAGPCGDVIVKSVRVGSGYRSLERKADAGVSGRAGNAAVGVEGGRQASSETLDRIAWSDPQAYAFDYDKVTQAEHLGLSVRLPETLVDGDALTLDVSARSTAYVIVVGFEESGAGQVLYPNSAVPQPMVLGPDEALRLPTTAEQTQMQVRLRDPSTAARETLVVFAFTSLSDFEWLLPQVLGISDGREYVTALTKALADVPISRWARVTVGYVIQPKGPA